MHFNIPRTTYLNKLFAFRDKQVIKVITGIRRCGKSTLLQMFQNELLKQNTSPEQIIAINFEDLDFEDLTDPKALHSYIKSRLSNEHMTYVFLDEIQHVKDFHRVLDSLFIQTNIDLYVTGSNAWLLSSEIATLISGRYIEIRMLPLSFKEFVLATNSEKQLNQAYRQYIGTSAFPYALAFENDKNSLHDYLGSMFHTIVFKDIQTRIQISDITAFMNVTKCLFDSLGSQISTKKIADTLTSSGHKMDVKTIDKYVSSLIESFVIYPCQRYDIRGRQYLKTLEKYYIADIGLRHTLIGQRNQDVGHILENIIFLELIRRGYRVYLGKLDQLEIDFIATTSSETCYFQVSSTIRDEITRQRELTPLQKLRNAYPKFVLTLDEDPESDVDGIHCINALDWLMRD